jgi:FMN phosphatase YigB (HAD superfamily)
MHRNFLFDLDQTLLDFHASEYKALGIVLRENGFSFSDGIYRAFKAYNQSLWLELEKGTITRTELFTKRFLDVFSRCEGDASRLDPLKVNDEFIRTMSVNGVLMEGALEFVKKVKNEIPFARIYIATNGATVNAKGRIASTGLDRYIDGLFISEEMGVTKPAAEFFDRCLEGIGEPGASCIMIGDRCPRICSAQRMPRWLRFGSCRREISGRPWQNTGSTIARLLSMNCSGS